MPGIMVAFAPSSSMVPNHRFDVETSLDAEVVCFL